MSQEKEDLLEIPEFLKRVEPVDKPPNPETDPVNVEHLYVQNEVLGGEEVVDDNRKN